MTELKWTTWTRIVFFFGLFLQQVMLVQFFNSYGKKKGTSDTPPVHPDTLVMPKQLDVNSSQPEKEKFDQKLLDDPIELEEEDVITVQESEDEDAD